MIVLIDNGHGKETPGKRSPDFRIREYAYCRDIARGLVNELGAEGIDARLLVPEESDVSLSERVRRVNEVVRHYSVRNVCLVSIHLNASGKGDWMPAKGWEVWTSPGHTAGDLLADCLYESAKVCLPGIKLRADFSDGDPDKESRFYILTHTPCAAALTENLFQDNRDDVAFLLTSAARKAIVDLHLRGISKFLTL